MNIYPPPLENCTRSLISRVIRYHAASVEIPSDMRILRLNVDGHEFIK
jgi:hypothetical protein